MTQIIKIERMRRFCEKKQTRRKNRKSALKTKKQMKSIQTWFASEVLTLKADKKTSRNICLDKINELKNLFSSKKTIVFDFSHVQIMYPDAVIYLLGTLCALKNRHSNVFLRCNHSMSERTKEVLHQVGLLKLLNWHCQIEPKREDVKHWRVAQSNQTDGKYYDDILKHYDGTLTKTLQDGFYRVMIEAMGNAVAHAYEQELMEEHPYKIRDWWIFSQEKDGMLTVVICDVGVGIPTSLPYKANTLDIIKSFLGSSKSHSHAIESAIKYSSTRTMQKHRGKGLHQIVTLLGDIPNSSVSIRSNKGLYIQHTADFTKSTKALDSKSGIIGTIISWSIPLPVKVEA